MLALLMLLKSKTIHTVPRHTRRTRLHLNNRRWHRLIIWLAGLSAVLGILPVGGVAAQIFPKRSIRLEPYGVLPLSFVPNTGQVDSNVAFQVRGMGGTLFFAADEIVFSLPPFGKEHPTLPGTGDLHENSWMDRVVSTKLQPTVVRLRFDDANPTPIVKPGDQLPGVVNYFIGNDPAKWKTNIPTYSGIFYENLYAGIDLRFEGSNGTLKSIYTVSPGVDPALIRWHYTGMESVAVEPTTGDLLVKLPGGNTMSEHRPIAWQERDNVRITVEARYTVASDGTVAFAIGSYDPALRLIIDPTLVYSTYVGGGGTDEGYGITVDNTGAAYVAGSTESNNFPLQNPFDSSLGGTRDVFVTKLAPGGTTLIYSTYLGGSRNDTGYNIALDSAGAAYITGFTESTNFPLQNPFDTTMVGFNEAFVTKLSPGGNTLIYSTYLGGSSSDAGLGIAVDAAGATYVAGSTQSANFPTQNAFDNSLGSVQDGFVTKLTPGGNALIYSTYLGGSNFDAAFGLALDSTGAAYVTGFTQSRDFPVQNAFDNSLGGIGDAIVTKFSPSGNALVYSTFLGGSYVDVGYSIAVDSAGAAYIAGNTDSRDFPLQNAFDSSLSGGRDVFVAKIAVAGNALAYSTYLGGSSADFLSGNGNGNSIAVDNTGAAYVTGNTQSTNFPIQNPYQTDQGGDDVFVTKFDPAGNTLSYSTYLGGSGLDHGNGIAVDSTGSAYLTGASGSVDFPVLNPFQPANAGGQSDAFVTKFGPAGADLAVSKADTPDPVTAGSDLTYSLAVTNNGPDVAANTTLTDPLPGNTTFQSLTAPAGWSCITPPVGSTGTISCSTAAFATGTVIFAVTVRVDLATPGGTILNNTVSVSTITTDPDLTNNTAVQTTGVNAIPTPTATITLEPAATAAPGGTGVVVVFDPAISKIGVLPPGGLGLKGEKPTWTITVTNRGDVAGQNITVIDTLRPELKIDGVETQKGTATVSGQTVTFYVGTLNPKETVTMQIRTTILDSPADGVIRNEACITGVDRRCATAEVRSASVLPGTGYPPSALNLRLLILAGIGILLISCGLATAALSRRQ